MTMPGRNEKNVMSFRVESHSARPRLRLHIINDVKLIRGVFMDNGKRRGSSRRSEGVACFRIEETGIGTRTNARGGNHFASVSIHHHQLLVVADRKQTPILLINRQSGWSNARRKRPAVQHL